MSLMSQTDVQSRTRIYALNAADIRDSILMLALLGMKTIRMINPVGTEIGNCSFYSESGLISTLVFMMC